MIGAEFVWSVDKSGLPGSALCFVTPWFAVIVGLLMVSRFRYFSFKALPAGERQRVPFVWMVAAVLLLALRQTPAQAEAPINRQQNTIALYCAIVCIFPWFIDRLHSFCLTPANRLHPTG